jgi:hypothetical protein
MQIVMNTYLLPVLVVKWRWSKWISHQSENKICMKYLSQNLAKAIRKNIRDARQH